eukprot:UN24468
MQKLSPHKNKHKEKTSDLMDVPFENEINGTISNLNVNNNNHTNNNNPNSNSPGFWSQFSLQDIGDLEFTRAMVKPLLDKAPIPIKNAESFLKTLCQVLTSDLINTLKLHLNKSMTQRDFRQIVQENILSNEKLNWCACLLQDVSTGLFLHGEEVNAHDVLIQIDDVLGRQEKIIIPGIIKAAQKHFGNTISKDNTESFTMSIFKTVQEHNLSNISVNIPRKLTPSEQSKLLKLTAIFDDSISLAILLSNNR